MHLCLVAATLAVPTDTTPVGASKSDLEQFQGTWKAASIVNDEGRTPTPEELQQTTLIVKGDRFTLKMNDATINGRFTINSAATPKTIDALLDATDGPPTTKLLGIYRIDGDTRNEPALPCPTNHGRRDSPTRPRDSCSSSGKVR
jgi:hypothetical protein